MVELGDCLKRLFALEIVHAEKEWLYGDRC